MTTPTGTTMVFLNEDHTGRASQEPIGLAVLQAGVDGMVAPVELTDEVTMWANDEGMMTHVENRVATEVVSAVVGSHLQPFFGPVVFTGGHDDEGAPTAIGDAAAVMLLRYIEQSAASFVS